MIPNRLPRFSRRLALPVALAAVFAVPVPAARSQTALPQALLDQLLAGTTAFVPLTLDGPDVSSLHRSRALLRWEAGAGGAVALQSERMRIHLSGGALTVDTGSGPVALPLADAASATDLVNEIRSGFAASAIAPLSDAALPAFARVPHVDLFDIDLPFPWADDLHLVIGTTQVDGALRVVALTDATGRPLTWGDLPLSARARSVAWGVALAPDIASPDHVSLGSLGAASIWPNGFPPVVLRDLPWHERMTQHPLALSPADSTGHEAYGLPEVVNAELTQDCNGQQTQLEPADLLWIPQPDDPSHGPLQDAIAAQCAFSFSADPAIAFTLPDDVDGNVDLNAQLVDLATGATLWSQALSLPRAGPYIGHSAPSVAIDLPPGVDPATLGFRLTLAETLACGPASSGLASLRTSLTGLGQPSNHWTCP